MDSNFLKIPQNVIFALMLLPIKLGNTAWSKKSCILRYSGLIYWRSIVFFILLLPLLDANSALGMNRHEQAKLRHGAKIFMSYCSGCHSLRYLRYNRMASDLGLSFDKDLLVNNLVATQIKKEDPIQISLAPTDARAWFGMVPPDLSLITREKGALWVHTYLKSFYADKSRPFGTNNTLVPEVAMPNVLKPLYDEVNQEQFEKMLEDLVNFLVYVGEPAKLVRYRLGVFVLTFLFIFIVVAYELKNIYWKKEKLSSEKEKI